MTHEAPSTVFQRSAKILDHRPIARDTYRLRLELPELAEVIRPGQFVMVRTAAEGSGYDPLLGRPFALYEVIHDTVGRPWAIDVVYLVIGRGTNSLSGRKPGESLSVWGPLGNGFGPPPTGHSIFVAGGIGQTPFLALGRWWTGQTIYAKQKFNPGNSVELLYGVRTRDLAAGLDDFKSSGIRYTLATDDGSAGHHGYVTDVLKARLQAGERPTRLVGCGPAPMLAALARLADSYEIDCDVSLENHMACGFGACFSCVTPIKQSDGTSDLKRVCVEGPIFSSTQVAWS